MHSVSNSVETSRKVLTSLQHLRVGSVKTMPKTRLLVLRGELGCRSIETATRMSIHQRDHGTERITSVRQLSVSTEAERPLRSLNCASFDAQVRFGNAFKLELRKALR